MKRCKTAQRAIRSVALSLLRQINGDYAGEQFHQLLESEDLKQLADFEHVRKIALIEVARRKVPNARSIVYEYLDWSSSTNLSWINEEVHARASVIEALSWFDDGESQQHIVEFWRTSHDYPTREASRDALIRVANRGMIDPSIARALVEWLTARRIGHPASAYDGHADNSAHAEVDYWGIRSVLIAIHDVGLARQLVADLADTREKSLECTYIIEVLKTFNEPEIIEALADQVRLHKSDLILCARFLDVLSEIEGDIPFEHFWYFAQHELPSSAKAYAIRGLGKLSFDTISQVVLAAIHPISYERLVAIKQDYVIGQTLRSHTGIEVVQMLTDFMEQPNLSEGVRTYLKRLLAGSTDASEIMRDLTADSVPSDVRWSIITNREAFTSQVFRQALMDLVDSGPYEDLLISEPCDYACVQNEIFEVLRRHGQIALLAKEENQPAILYNTSSEKLFQFIRTDKVYEMEQFISRFIQRRVDADWVISRRMVVDTGVCSCRPRKYFQGTGSH